MATPKSWDRPAPLPSGDLDPVAIYAQVGIATSSWETLQINLMYLFCVLCASESLNLQRAFGTLEPVPSKIRMIKAAAELHLLDHPQLGKRLKDTLAEVENFSLRRNDIAHGHVCRMNEHGIDLGHYLIPGPHITEKTSIVQKAGRDFSWWDYKLTSSQIRTFTEHFNRVRKDVVQLISDVRSIKAVARPSSLKIGE